MVIYLRNSNRTNLFEVEVWNNKEGIDMSTHVYAENCFKHIVAKIEDKEYIEGFIKDFGMLEELRGWYWEQYRQSKNPQDYESVLKELRKIIRLAADELKLYVVED